MLSNPGRRLRDLFSADVVPMPGAFNALCARAIERAGFPAVYISGAGLSNAVFGLPDVGLFTLTEAAAHARAICAAVNVPVLADADTGFGEAINAARTVVELERCGLAGIHVEDQVLPKKCGHLDGKEVVPPEAMVEKLRAAIAARLRADFVVIARTDARAIEGFDRAVDRAKRYLDAGADGIFPEALQSAEEFERFARALHGCGATSSPGAPPVLIANMTEFGKSPLLPLSQLASLGYRIVIYPQTALRVAFSAITAVLADLKATGTQTVWLDRMQTRAALYELLDYDGLNRIDRAATGG
ncbi:MAG: methylisocitrate lyase [Phycisphaerae bacterium]|nr:methylisocitrate lyase [Phycisphaerae bacterium]